MPDPGAAVTTQEGIQKVLRFAGHGQHGQTHQAQSAAHKMHAAAGSVVVLAQVKRVKLSKTGVLNRGCFSGVHGMSPRCLSD
jgi:hypothetical protein